MKCDENRPSCANCSKARHRCSYLDLYSSRSATLGYATPSQSETQTVQDLSSPVPPLTPGLSETITCPTTCPEEPPAGFPEELPADRDEVVANRPDESTGPPPPVFIPGSFNIGHLGLLHHLEHELMQSESSWLVPDIEKAKLHYDAIFKAAMSAPYLMDQMLAISALHMSSTAPSDSADKAKYHYQASELHTRALGLFNAAKPQVNEENALPMLTFSSFVGLQSFFDTMASRDGEFSDFLSRFTKYLHLHRGVRIIAHQGWDFLRQTQMSHIINAIEDGDKARSQQDQAGKECDHVEGLLKSFRQKLGQDTYDVCQKALDSLRWVLDCHRTLPKPYPIHIAMAWPSVITPDFIELLEQRQPISLVILAHWAMLLHMDREFWVFGDAGRFMIVSLSKYLGPYWQDWLAVPEHILVST